MNHRHDKPTVESVLVRLAVYIAAMAFVLILAGGTDVWRLMNQAVQHAAP